MILVLLAFFGLFVNVTGANTKECTGQFVNPNNRCVLGMSISYDFRGNRAV